MVSGRRVAPRPGRRHSVNMPATTALPRGPKLTLLQSLLYKPRGGRVGFFEDVARLYGDLAYYKSSGEQFFFVNDPLLIYDILVTHDRNFIKGRGLQRLKRVLGEGLLTSEGAVHRRQRRLI